MALRLTIAGNERASYVDFAPGPIEIEDIQNERPRASFTCIWGYVPNRFDEVVIYENDETTPAFGGFILSRLVAAVLERAAPSRCRVECVGFIAYADYAYITLSYDEEVAIEDVIADIVTAKLAAYGITYTPTETGLTVAPFSCERKRVSDLLRELGIGIRVSPTKVLTTYEPGDAAAPFEIHDADPNCYELTWEDDGELPPTTVVLVCGAGMRDTEEVFEADGSGTVYQVGYPASHNINALWPNPVIVDGSEFPVWWGPDDGPPQRWYWDYENGTLVNTGTPLAMGTMVTVRYAIQYPFEVSATTGGSPDVEEVIARTDILYREYGQEQAALRLATIGPPAKVVHIHTRVSGAMVGHAIPVDITRRGGIDEEVVIQSIRTEIRSDHVRHYFIDATSAVALRRSYLAEWRELTGGGSGGTPVVVSGVGGGGGGSVVHMLPYRFGGARNRSVVVGTATWADLPDHFPFIARSTFTAEVRVEIWARAAGVSVKARMYNETDAIGVESDSVTSQTPESVAFVVAIEAGKTYRLQVGGASADGVDVYGIGVLDPLAA